MSVRKSVSESVSDQNLKTSSFILSFFHSFILSFFHSFIIDFSSHLSRLLRLFVLLNLPWGCIFKNGIKHCTKNANFSTYKWNFFEYFFIIRTSCGHRFHIKNHNFLIQIEKKTVPEWKPNHPLPILPPMVCLCDQILFRCVSISTGGCVSGSQWFGYSKIDKLLDDPKTYELT